MSILRLATLTIGACVVAVLVTFSRPATAGQAEDLAKGASLLADARKAIGGEDKLADVKRLQIKGTMRRGQGNLTLEGDSEIFLEPPDKFRRNESLSIGLGGPGIERVEILNGTEVIDENSGGRGPGRGDFGGRGGDFGGGFRRGGGGFGGGNTDARNTDGQGARGQIDPGRLKDAQRRNRQAEVTRLLVAMLLNTSAPVAWVGTAQSPEGNADVLEINTTEGTPTRLFLDTATHIPLMLTWTGGGRGARAGQPPAAREGDAAAPAAGAEPGSRRGGGGPAGQTATFEMHLSDYKVVSGLKLPHLITRGTNGETSEEWTIKSYKINPNFKANTFTK